MAGDYLEEEPAMSGTDERVREPRIGIGCGVNRIREISRSIVHAAEMARIPDWFCEAMEPILEERYGLRPPSHKTCYEETT